SPASSGCWFPPPTRTAAEVSSHEVSMPRTTSATAALALQGHGIRYSMRDDPGWGADREPGVPARPGLPDEMRDDAHAVAGERVYPRLRAEDGDRHALGREQKAREPGCCRGDRHGVDRPLHDRGHFPRHAHRFRRDADHAERGGVDGHGLEEGTTDAR